MDYSTGRALLSTYTNSNFTCSGWCCKVSDYSTKIPDWTTIYWFNTILSIVLVIMTGFIAFKMIKSYARIHSKYSLSSSHLSHRSYSTINSMHSVHSESSGRKPSSNPTPPPAPEVEQRRAVVRPLFNGYALVAAFWFLLQALALLLPPSDATTIIQLVLYVGHAFLDNAIIIWCFFRRASKTAIYFTVGITLLIVGAKAIFTIAYYSLVPLCSVCSLYFPAPQAFYAYIFFTILYVIVLCLMAYNRPIGPIYVRRTSFYWTLYLFIVYSIATIGSGILLFSGSGSGFCLVEISVILYTTVYAPLLYYTFVLDTEFVRKQKREVSDALSSFAIVGEQRDFVEEARKELQIQCPRAIWIDVKRDIKKGPRIGVGASAEVYRGSWAGTPVAVKRLYADSYSSLDSFVREVGVMTRLAHPNILLFLGVSVDSGGDRYIITEYMSKGSVYSLLHPPSNRMNDADCNLTSDRVYQILTHAARGMAYLHSFQPPIIHGDLKSQNLLVDDNWNVKVADFGLSNAGNAEEQMEAGPGTPQWSAPEVIRRETFTEKADVFSFGIIIYEVLTRKIPYDGVGALTAAHAVAYNNLRPRFLPECTPEYVDLAKECWAEDPKLRPSFEQLVKKLAALSPPSEPPPMPQEILGGQD